MQPGAQYKEKGMSEGNKGIAAVDKEKKDIKTKEN